MIDNIIYKKINKDKMVATIVNGKSMQPFLYDNDQVIIVKSNDYKLHDICLFEYHYRYILHRLIKIDGDKYIFKGDNCVNHECVSKEQIIGVLCLVNKNNKCINITDKINKRYYKLSLLLLPYIYLKYHFRILFKRKYYFVINIAGLYININCFYEYTFLMCKKYITSKKDHIDIDINYSFDEIKNYIGIGPNDYREFIMIYDLIARELYKYNKLIIHGAAISYNDNAYLFVGDSGIGKTTHICLLKENYNEINIINGDKPIIDGNGYVYGTPWSGKENYNNNISFKLKSIIFVNRDSYNHVELLDKKDCIKKLLDHIYKDSNFNKILDVINNAFNDVSFYDLFCNVSDDAAKVTFDRIISK